MADTPGSIYDDDESESTKVTKPGPRASGTMATGAASLVVVYVSMSDSAGQADLGRRIPITADQAITIGRAPQNALHLDQEDVSRRHAKISRENGAFVVVDLGSRNGTSVNDVSLGAEPRVLRDGDRITIGSTILKFIHSDTENEFHEVIYRLKVEDALTRIHNKRFFMEFLEREVARAQRHAGELALVLFDIDHFKRINDTYGHLAGDAVLRDLAARVKPLVRREQCLARYGGEEFAIVLPETPIDGARVLAEKIRAGVEGQRFAFGTTLIPVTVSLGVAAFVPGTADQAAFIGAADAKLYEAKRGGRNRVVG